MPSVLSALVPGLFKFDEGYRRQYINRGLSVVDKFFNCSSNNVASNASDAANRRRDAMPTMDMQTELVKDGWDAANAFADACRESGTDIGPFMSTTFVARDMLKIVETLNEDGMLRYLGLFYSTRRLLGSL